MIGKEEVARLKEEIAFHPGPLLSLYVATNPADPNVTDYWAGSMS
jgi:hypothetical protein